MTITRRTFAFSTTLAVLAGPAFGPAFGQGKPAIGGYDTVAYFTVGKPTKGSESIAHVWDGKRYLFVSEQNRALFVANPDKYAPQFNAYCAASLAGGAKIEADPQHWMITDGRLYLFGGPVPPDIMAKNPQMAGQAEANWRKLN